MSNYLYVTVSSNSFTRTLMQDFFGTYTLWLKAFHVIFVIAWMAGLLYLPRLFAYHVAVGYDSKACSVFKIMERKLLKIIMNPAMILSWIFGILMLYGNPALLDFLPSPLYFVGKIN